MQEYFAGFDVGRTFHVLVVVDESGKTVLKRRVENTFEAVTEAAERVQSGTSEGEVYWAVEMVDRNARMLVETLVRMGKKVYQSTPYRLKRFKEAAARPRKSDLIDAAALANLLRLRRHELTAINIPSKEVLMLRNLSRSANRLSDERTRQINHLEDVITSYCPDLIVKWPGYSFACKTMLRLLKEYPDIASMAALGDAVLLSKVKRFSNGKFGQEHVAVIKRAAETLVRRGVCTEPHAGDILDAIDLIELIDAKLAEKGRLLEKALCECEVAERLMKLSGISVRIAGTIIGEVGDIKRFASEAKFATYCGLAPLCRQSGKSKGTNRLARQTNKRLLRVMYLSALSSIKCYGLSKAYYQRKLAGTDAGHVDKIRAIIALARHRCRIIFKILSREGYVYEPKQTEQPFVEGRRDGQHTMRVPARGAVKTGQRKKDMTGEAIQRPAAVEVRDAAEDLEIALLLQQGTTTPLPEHAMTE